jgi:hypothetical protein
MTMRSRDDEQDDGVAEEGMTGWLSWPTLLV